MNFIEAPATWAVIAPQYLLSGFNKATCRVAAGRTTKNGRDKNSERMWITTYNYVFYPRPRLYTKVIIIRLFLIYGCDKKLEDPIRQLRMLCLLTWFCINDLQNIEFQNEQPHSYWLLPEEFAT